MHYSPYPPPIWPIEISQRRGGGYFPLCMISFVMAFQKKNDNFFPVTFFDLMCVFSSGVFVSKRKLICQFKDFFRSFFSRLNIRWKNIFLFGSGSCNRLDVKERNFRYNETLRYFIATNTSCKKFFILFLLYHDKRGHTQVCWKRDTSSFF